MNFQKLLRDGIPEKYLTGTSALVAGLLIVVSIFAVSIVFEKIHDVIWPVPIPDCFRAEAPIVQAPDRTARQTLVDLFGPDATRGKGQDVEGDRVLAAMKLCPPQDCTSTANQEWRSAMFWYMTLRDRKIHEAQSIGGKAGLAEAINFYRRPLDQAIDQGLRDRFSAGLVDLRSTGWSQLGEIIPIIIFRGADAVRACGRLD